MKSFPLTGGLLVLSFMLGGAVVWLLVRKPAPTVGPELRQVVATNHVVIRTPAPSRSPTAQPTVTEFSWAAVEAADYHQYIANLRAIDCPEETIRDIIIADVNKLYARGSSFQETSGSSRHMKDKRRQRDSS
jgi:hypothetical protein